MLISALKMDFLWEARGLIMCLDLGKISSRFMRALVRFPRRKPTAALEGADEQRRPSGDHQLSEL